MSKITEEQLVNWFTYHSPTPEQQLAYLAIRGAGLALARVIVDSCPPSADATAALRKCREAVSTANMAIACSGK